MQEALPEDSFAAFSLARNYDHALRALGLLLAKKARQDLKRAVPGMAVKVEARGNGLFAAPHRLLILTVFAARVEAGFEV